MIQIHLYLEGRDAVHLLRELVELESVGAADRAGMKQLAANLRQHAAAVSSAMSAATPAPAPPPAP